MLESLFRLRLLREIDERGSLSAAARALHLTQPAASRQLARLERETGMRLVDRGARRARLTDAGAALVVHAEALLGRAAVAENELEALRGLRGGRVRVASFPSGGATIVVAAMARFASEHPAVDVTYRDAGLREAISGVRSATLDIALVFTHEATAPHTEGLELVRLLRDPMFVALPPSHRLAARRRVRLADLAGDSWVAGMDPALTVRACRDAGFEPDVRYSTDHARIAHGLVAAGAAVTLVNGLGLPYRRRDIAVRPVAGQGLARDVFAAVLAARPRLPAVGAFVGELERAAKRFAT